MSHVTPLLFSKECIVHYRMVYPSGPAMLPSILSCCPMLKGSKKFTSAVKTTFMSVLLSQSYGYCIHIILELCSKFRVIDVGLIMALLRRDYSRRHHLIIRETILETKLSTLRSVCLNDRFSRSRHRFTSLTFWSIESTGCSTSGHLFALSRLY